jgi:hypothetical protein
MCDDVLLLATARALEPAHALGRADSQQVGDGEPGAREPDDDQKCRRTHGKDRSLLEANREAHSTGQYLCHRAVADQSGLFLTYRCGHTVKSITSIFASRRRLLVSGSVKLQVSSSYLLTMGLGTLNGLCYQLPAFDTPVSEAQRPCRLWQHRPADPVRCSEITTDRCPASRRCVWARIPGGSSTAPRDNCAGCLSGHVRADNRRWTCEEDDASRNKGAAATPKLEINLT